MDCPVAFGYKCAWLAFPTEKTTEVADALEFKQIGRANWQTGIEAAYDHQSKIAFVTPPVHGWTFVVGTVLSSFFCGYDKDSINATIKKYQIVAEYFEKFYFFATHRVSDAHAWAMIKNHEIVRFFICGEGELVYNYGALTPEELEMGMDNLCYDCEDEDEWDNKKFVEEDDVLQLSEQLTVQHLVFENEPKTSSLGIVLKCPNR